MEDIKAMQRSIKYIRLLHEEQEKAAKPALTKSRMSGPHSLQSLCRRSKLKRMIKSEMAKYNKAMEEYKRIAEDAEKLDVERLRKMYNIDDKYLYRDGYFYDPVEDTPEYIEAMRIIWPKLRLYQKKGYTQLYSYKKKSLLKEVFGIDWMDPEEICHH